jgi:Sulfatase-modifying factor enzyme 1
VHEHDGDPDFPVTAIDAFEAEAFCRYMGKRLPGDHEWAKAARGGLTVKGARNLEPRRLFPWGTELDDACVNQGGDVDDSRWIAPVDRFACGASPYGILNMVGNVSEWVARAGQVDRADNPLHVTRGGDIMSPRALEHTTTVFKNSRNPRHFFLSLGVRCIAAPKTLTNRGTMTTPTQTLPLQTLTIIAKAPNPRKLYDTRDRNGIRRLKQAINSTPTNAVDDLARKIRTHERASTVTEVDLILKHKHPRETSIVQIVGHASPGRLSLGQYWTGRYFDSKYYYAIDSNPSSYALLKRNLRRGQTLRLLGCAVGADAPGFASNGTTLLFALEQLLQPEGIIVEASVQNINPDDFEADGTFIAQHKLAGQAISRPASARERLQAPTCKAGGALSAVAASAFAAVAPPTTIRFLGRNQSEVTGAFQEVKPPHLPLALSLYTTTAQIGAQMTRYRADLLRLEDHYQLRLSLPEETRYYIMDALAEAELVQLARESEFNQSSLIRFKTSPTAAPFSRQSKTNLRTDSSSRRSSSEVGGCSLKRLRASTAFLRLSSEPVSPNATRPSIDSIKATFFRRKLIS